MATLDKVFKDASVKKLFKDLLILAQYVGQRQGNEKVLKEQVRQQFKANMYEVDEEKIIQQKEAAMRALGNFYFQEAERLAREKGPKRK
ncbi:MAG: hypothetical protein J3K34DRAFT_432083 [Monoraphidium minutum]|nr:MAG: hypothetical protein J3K34DRAFT_432083 [Monoraphidium minutum]